MPIRIGEFENAHTSFNSLAPISHAKDGAVNRSRCQPRRASIVPSGRPFKNAVTLCGGPSTGTTGFASTTIVEERVERRGNATVASFPHIHGNAGSPSARDIAKP